MVVQGCGGAQARSHWRSGGRQRRRRTACAAAATLVLLAGCGGTPTATSHPEGGFAQNKKKTQQALKHIYSQLKGLDLQARKQKLISLAKKEGGSLTWYTPIADDDSKKLIEQFREQTGIDVQLYRASSATVLQRTLQEKKAGRVRADVLNFTGLDPTIAAKKGMFAELETPYKAKLVDRAVHKNWVADQLYPFVASWNTQAVAKSQAPKTYKDLLKNFRDGNMGYEMTDQNWVFGIVQVLESKGMSESAALDLVKGAFRGGVPVQGHTLSSQLLAAGKYKVLANSYHYRAQRQVAQGAPVAWQPALKPILVTPSGSGISVTAAHPAAALLFLEFQLTGEQKYWVGAGRTPTNKNYTGGIFKFPQAANHLRFINSEKLYSHVEKWNKILNQMVQSSGRKPKTD